MGRNAFTDFVRKHGGQGYKRDELVVMYRQQRQQQEQQPGREGGNDQGSTGVNDGGGGNRSDAQQENSAVAVREPLEEERRHRLEAELAALVRQREQELATSLVELRDLRRQQRHRQEEQALQQGGGGVRVAQERDNMGPIGQMVALLFVRFLYRRIGTVVLVLAGLPLLVSLDQHVVQQGGRGGSARYRLGQGLLHLGLCALYACVCTYMLLSSGPNDSSGGSDSDTGTVLAWLMGSSSNNSNSLQGLQVRPLTGLWRRLALLPVSRSFPLPSAAFLDVARSVYFTDLLARCLVVAAKALLVSGLLPSSLPSLAWLRGETRATWLRGEGGERRAGGRGAPPGSPVVKLRTLALLEMASTLYRSLLPVPLWGAYLLTHDSKPDPLKGEALWLDYSLLLVYMALKGGQVCRLGKGVALAGWGCCSGGLVSGHRGRLATPQEVAGAADPDCSICHEALSARARATARLDCGHLFCRDCIGEWLYRQGTCCPICRQTVGEDAWGEAVPRHYREGTTAPFPTLM